MSDPRIVTLCSELERLFELDDLKALTRDLLGLDPDEVGGGGAKGSYVKSLTERCVQHGSVEALCDAVLAWHDSVDPKILDLSAHGFTPSDELDLGESFGDYLILRKLGRGRLGTSYLARHDGADVRLKVLRPEATFDRKGLHRFMTANRIIASLGQPGLPRDVSVGEVDGRFYVAHAHIEGHTVAQRLSKTGAMHIEEARSLIRGVVDALSALHARRLAHGDLRPENVLFGSDEAGRDVIMLLDPGSHYLTVHPAAANGKSDRLSALGSPKTIAPEQIEGRLADARSDLYSFGALLFELLTGRPVFQAKSTAEMLMAHLTREPDLPSLIAPAGWVGEDIDDFVTHLLNKDPAHRPNTAEALLETIDSLGTAPSSPEEILDPEELEERVRELLNNPTDEFAEEGLVAAIRQGGDIQRIAETLKLAASLIDGEGAFDQSAQQRLLSRAAKLYDATLKDPATAEELYDKLVSIDPHDEVALAALDRVRKQLGKHEEIVESLLERVERTDNPEEKARLLGEIGRLYADELDDKEQALVAYTQAFCEHPEEPSYVQQVEQLAGQSTQSWEEVLTSCIEASEEDKAPAAQAALLSQMGKWYSDRLGRPDLALPCYQALLELDPADDAALEGAAAIYRKTGHWHELGNVLIMRADAPGTPGPLARDLRTEAAGLLAARLGNPAAARELYEQVLAEDPSHEQAVTELGNLYEQAGDYASYAKLLERRAEALSGQEQLDAMLQLAEAYELQLKDLPEAIRHYRTIIAKDPKHLDALQGLDRCLSQAENYEDLIDNLHLQLEAATTPRQKILLWERIAAVWDEEFLNHAKAAEAWENVLDLDSEHDSALTSLARHYRALDRHNDVVIILERHVDLLENAPERRIEKTLALGRALAEGIKVPERAIEAYERVLSWDPQNAEALQALAALRATTGETSEAVAALEALARDASTPQAKAEQYIRAAQLLEEHGDPDGAIERYKLAVEANPQDRSASTILRAAYISRGDNNAAAELLEQEIKNTESETTRAKLAGELAAHCLDRLGNDSRAESWAKVALDVDPTNLDALRVRGDLAFAAKRYVEASRYYEQVANRTDALTQPRAVRVLSSYITCLIKNDKGKQAVEIGDRLLSVAPDELDAVAEVARLHFEHGNAERAYDLYSELGDRLPEDATSERRAEVLYRLGESARRVGKLGTAYNALEESLRLNPAVNEPLRSLAQLYSTQQNWEKVIEVMYRQLENVEGDDKISLLLEIGDLAGQKLKDPSYAAKSYLAALSEKPTDRRILMKLMQLYSEEKDWDRLVKVILKLADFVDDHKQKSKYLTTAGRVSWREMNDARRGSQLLARALELDPDNADLIKDGVQVHTEAGNYDALKELLKRQIKLASDAGRTDEMLRAMTALAELYLKHFQRMEQAIAVLEEAQRIDPSNVEREELLSRLYEADLARYAEQAAAVQHKILERDPFRPQAHRLLRRSYTESKRPDPAWCCCQALAVLGQAEPDEERFFTRIQSDEAAAPQSRLNDTDFHACLMHPKAEPLLTALFTVIQPAIVAARSKPLDKLGYGPGQLIDPSRHQFAAAQMIPYVADVMTMPCPPMFENPNDLGELSFLHGQPPAIVLGTSVVGVAMSGQTAAFMAGRHLTYYRPGLYIRQLVPTAGALKAWLFAAISIVVPGFPIPADLHGPVGEARRVLETGITGPARDHLNQVVNKLLQSGAALDLKKWAAMIDLTADRVGFLFADDLATAVELIRASDPRSSAASVEQRVEEIYRYAVSEPYFDVRKRLGIAIDS